MLAGLDAVGIREQDQEKYFAQGLVYSRCSVMSTVESEVCIHIVKIVLLEVSSYILPILASSLSSECWRTGVWVGN